MILQLETAEQLINDLGSERVRWGEEKNRLILVFKNFIGDCLISSAFTNYTGGFTHDFRVMMIKQFIKDANERKIFNSSGTGT